MCMVRSPESTGGAAGATLGNAPYGLFYVHWVILFPSLSVNAPTIIMMKSISTQIPSPPNVTNCNMPVPIFPT